MSMLDELVVIAAIGTARKPPALPAETPAVADAAAALASDSPEAQLLGAVAILSRYQAAGRLPGQATLNLDPAGNETRPACGRRAAELLSQVLALSNTPAKTQTAAEWLDRCQQTGRRVPHRLLPGLLDYGASHRDARPMVATVAGARGAWLMRLNPRWRHEVAESEDPASVWNTGKSDQRLAALSRQRRLNPAAGRELILSTWNEDAAEDRAAFVAELIQVLSPEDEPFLESALDDRSKLVRSAAADLLARLPSSAYVRRMIERAGPLLKLIPANRSGLLRKLAPASVDITLPPDAFDPASARDGVTEKPPERIGRRQWFLQQFLAAIPLTHWSTAWDLPPDKCIDATNGEYADVVLSAWHQAAARHPDPTWIASLLRTSAKEGRGPLTLELLNQLPDAMRQTVTAEIIQSPRITPPIVGQLLRVGRFSLDANAAAAVARQIENVVAAQPSTYSYHLSSVLQDAALRMPPDLYDALSERWTGEAWMANRKPLDEFFAMLLIRRNIQREFDS
jgi:hypothetical protein